MTISPELRAAYRYNRQTYPRHWAINALANARKDVAEGKTRYPSSVGDGHYNSPFKIRSFENVRWIEKPSLAGLRFVGYADEISKAHHSRAIDHNGWYTSEFQDELVRGVVFQLPARDGLGRYVAGYDNAVNGAADKDGPCAVCFETIFIGDDGGNSYDYRADGGALEAARSSDQLAEWLAESEREYSEASNKGLEYSELGDTIAETRKETLELFAELREARADIGARFPALCASITGAIKANWRDIQRAKRTRAALLCEYGKHEGFNDV